MLDNQRLAQALKDILNRVNQYSADSQLFKEVVTTAFWEFKDRDVELDCKFIKKWLTDEGCPETHLNRIIPWCRTIRRGGPRYRGPFAKQGRHVWADDIWEQWGERARA